MSSATSPASQALVEAEFISSLMKAGDVFEQPLQQRCSKITNRPKKVDFDDAVNRESLLFKSVEYTVPIFHPVEQTSKLNLLIEVTQNQVLQGVVICDLEFICDNIPVIRNKYKTSNENTYKLEQKEGKSVYKLECDVEPRLVCEFIKAIYNGSIELDQDNVMGFYFLADFWSCDCLLLVTSSYIIDNMSNELMIDALSHGDRFQSVCYEFIEIGDTSTSSHFEPELLLRTIQKLPEVEFVDLMNFLTDPEISDGNHINSRLFVKVVLNCIL